MIYRNNIFKKEDLHRLKKVKDTYWQHSDQSDFVGISNAIISVANMRADLDKIKVVYDLLPSNIFGKAIMCGFSDSEVIDDIDNFMYANIGHIKGLLRVDKC